MKNIHKKWTNIKFSDSLALLVPKASGIYAIVEVNRVYGLPTGYRVLYIGKTKNLRRRLLDHVDRRKEHNEELYNLNNREKWEYWFIDVPLRKLDIVEKEFIKTIKPKTNKILYGGV